VATGDATRPLDRNTVTNIIGRGRGGGHPRLFHTGSWGGGAVRVYISADMEGVTGLVDAGKALQSFPAGQCPQ
jgi:hypothetical protein